MIRFQWTLMMTNSKSTMGLLTSLASDEEDELVPPVAAAPAEVEDNLFLPTPTKKEVKE